MSVPTVQTEKTASGSPQERPSPDQPPPLPAHISSNGQEVWDWAGRLSQWSQRQEKRRRLIADIAECGTQCGDCERWMKSRECPREKNVNGYSRGPSMSAHVCGSFVMAPLAAARRERLQAELQAILVGASTASTTDADAVPGMTALKAPDHD